MQSTGATLTVNTFLRQIHEGMTPAARSWRRDSVSRVLSAFEQAKPNMCPAALSETFRFLTCGKWINDARVPSAHPGYKAIRGCAGRGAEQHRRYYPNLLVLKALWPRSRAVRKLVVDFEMHWGVVLDEGYPEGADPEREFALFSGWEVDKCEECGTRWCVCHLEDAGEEESASYCGPSSPVETDDCTGRKRLASRSSNCQCSACVGPSGRQLPAPSSDSAYSTPSPGFLKTPAQLETVNRAGQDVRVSSYKYQVDYGKPITPSPSGSRSRDGTRAPEHFSPATCPVTSEYPYDPCRYPGRPTARKADPHIGNTISATHHQRLVESEGGMQKVTESQFQGRPMHYMSVENDHRGWYMSPVDRKRKLAGAGDSDDEGGRRVKREY